MRGFLLAFWIMFASPVAAEEELRLDAPEAASAEAALPGLVRLHCRGDAPGQLFSSRAVLLRTEARSGRGDIFLASRHAVVKRGEVQTCWVAGEPVYRGEIVRIVVSSRENPDNELFIHDWALLESARRISRHDEGLRAAVLRGREALSSVSLLNPLRTDDACNLVDEPLIAHHPALIGYDCPTRPGQSGTPILVEYEGTPHVIGLHVGRVSELGVDRDWVSVARLIDADVQAALTRMLDDEGAGD